MASLQVYVPSFYQTLKVVLCYPAFISARAIPEEWKLQLYTPTVCASLVKQYLNYATCIAGLEVPFLGHIKQDNQTAPLSFLAQAGQNVTRQLLCFCFFIYPRNIANPFRSILTCCTQQRVNR